ncbi:phage GP46 family protein [Blastomonas fulva]|uniref:phage GP46 family protein n=1 Tax=Blastomonas fulva TaxID=1550728 RepID=UPI0025A454AE|nr:phage GP46 family protein [Blastomonas fulva]MDM7928654.1 phage GP46 family protein [Blastomonas fulva]MDM7964440.1 phage GP46 family protein [Blastomonas fulva]
MTDAALVWNAGAWHGDIALDRGAVVLDGGLRTAILISLFTDARAPADAPLPEESADRRGWWGDDFPASQGRRGETGSLLWLLARSKITQGTINRAREYTIAALQWLLTDGIASRLDVQVEAQERQRLAIRVELDRPQGPARELYDFVWEASA